MKWNNAQLSAITEKDKNILVSAAAGSGKTAVLTERICRLVKEGCGIDEMLIVTFTNAAAGEMRERIAKGLTEAMENEAAGSREMKWLRDQSDKINMANISTFHAFCYEVVRRFFFMTELTGDFRLCDETQGKIFAREAMEETLDEFFQKENPDFLRFLRRFSKPGNESGISSMIELLHKHIQSLPYPEKWLRESVEALKTGGRPSPVYEFSEAGSRAAAVSAEGEASAAASGAEEEPAEGMTSAADSEQKPDAEARVGENPHEIIEAGTYKDACVLRDLTLRFGELLLEKKLKLNQIGFDDAQHFALKILEDPEASGEYRERFRYIFIDEYQDTNSVQEALISRICRKDNLFMVGDVKQSIYHFRLADPGIFIDKYSRYRAGEAPDSIKIDLNSNFRSENEILEITNEVMKELMTEESCGLDYDEDASLKHGLPEAEAEIELDPRPELKILLKDDIAAKISEINAEEAEELEEFSEGENEALVVCREIKKLIGRTCYDHKEGRVKALQYKDIVIIMRSFKAVSQIYQDVFRREGIPCYVEGGDSYFETAEISVFVNLLKVIMNRRQDIPLLSVLKSSCFGFDSNELAKIRIFRRKGLFSEAFLAYAGESCCRTEAEAGSSEDAADKLAEAADCLAKADIKPANSDDGKAEPEHGVQMNIADLLAELHRAEEAEAEEESSMTAECGPDELLVKKCRAALEKIGRWRELSGYIPLKELLWKIAEESGYYLYIQELPLAAQRTANLKKLFDLAENYQNSTSQGLTGFIYYLEKLSVDQAEFSGGVPADEDANFVRITNIHRSKGLEFPVVFIAGMGKKINHRTASSDLSLDKDIGLGLKFKTEDGSLEYKTQRQLRIEAQVRHDEQAEEMRLLYVAMTRARSKLIMVGTTARDKDGNLMADACAKAPADRINYLQWVFPAMFSKHTAQVEIISEQPEYGASEEPAEGTSAKADAETAETAQAAEEARGEAAETAPEAEGPTEKAEERASAEGTEELSRRGKGFVYPYEEAAQTSVKFTATELTRIAGAEASEKTNKELTEKSSKKAAKESASGKSAGASSASSEKAVITAAERGTITHEVLQNLNLREVHSLEAIKAQIAGFVEGGLLSEAEAEVVNVRSITKFFERDLGRRLIAADRIYREKEFLLWRPVDDEAGSIIQGIIDCFFIEDGQAVIIDYKTDFIPDEGRDSVLEEKKAYYKTQVGIYREAVEKSTGLKVKEIWLSFLSGEVDARIEY